MNCGVLGMTPQLTEAHTYLFVHAFRLIDVSCAWTASPVMDKQTELRLTLQKPFGTWPWPKFVSASGSR
jgi:hypothetical protein